jgi:signal transduction histidine kinase/CheY-like chemotaxis protein
MLINIVGGALWGSLAWVALDPPTLSNGILVVSVIAAFSAGAVSTQGPVLPLFIGFVIPLISVLTAKMWSMDGEAYQTLAFAGVLYILFIFGLAKNGAKSVRASIDLRFENIELMEKLRAETLLSESARLDAVRANAAKSKFLAAASHDLRQPIHAQGLFMEVLASTALSQQQRTLLANASAAGQASAEMLNTLLDFSRIEAGVIDPLIQPFRLQTLLNKIEREFAPQADSDPALVELILRNLVSNAIRYTTTGGLLVACRKRGTRTYLEVWDTGIGIEASQFKKVFQEFHQLGNPERDRSKGMGLGLAIAQSLSRQLGHCLTLDSRLNRGSVFRLALPITVNQWTQVMPLPLTTPGTLAMTRVLVIDDDASVLAGMAQLLCSWGCICLTASCSTDALQLLGKAQIIDLVISDFRLREQHSGIDAIEAVRAIAGHNLPALLVTGDTAPDRLREAQTSRLPLLHKPVSPESLHRAMVLALKRTPAEAP